jgi:cytochrome c biogenesis protein CcmG, thiol:disulfide interchange protein DsbE
MFPARHRAFAAAALLSVAFAVPADALGPGDTAPDFSAPGLTGGTVSLAAHRGKVVYLDFWASWCGPCAQSLPALDKLRKEFAPGDFQVVAVNVDPKLSAAKAFLRKRPVGYPSAVDPKGALPARFGVESMPTSFLIDRDGVVRHVHRGFREGDVAELRAQIEKLVAQRRQVRK